MSVVSGSILTNSAPANVGSGDYTYTVVGDYDCNSTVFPIEIDAALILTAGRYVVLRASGAIQDYVGATFAWVNGVSSLSCLGISREPVNYAGTIYDCIVVTLV